MSIIQKIKNILSSEEVKDLKTEVKSTAAAVANVAKEKVEEAKDVVDKKVRTIKGETITFDHFMKMDMRVGTIVDAVRVEKSEKLYKLSVDFGEESPRTVVSGIAKHFTMKSLKNRQALFVTNLEPRSIMGIESQAMIVAVSDDTNFCLLSPEKEIISGTKAG